MFVPAKPLHTCRYFNIGHGLLVNIRSGYERLAKDKHLRLFHGASATKKKFKIFATSFETAKASEMKTELLKAKEKIRQQENELSR
jgi:hypothetical protein